MRDLFFAFRGLVVQKKINVENMPAADRNFLKDEIRCNPEWTPAQYFSLYHILQEYTSELRMYGIGFDAVGRPSAEGMQGKSYEVKAATTRVESVLYQEERFVVYFRYTPEKHLAMKKIPGRQYDPETKTWSLPIDAGDDVKAFADTFNIPISDSARRVISAYGDNLEQSYAHERVELGLPLKRELYDYQTVGADFCIRVMKSILADQMGLGKTPQAIATAVGINKWPVLIICPKSLRRNWQDEIHAWTNYKALIATEKNIGKLSAFIDAGLCHFLIVNYEGVKKFFVREVRESKDKKKRVITNGREKLFQGMIIDEAHEAKNPSTMRAKCIKAVSKDFAFRQALTGTPFVNHAKDLGGLLELVGMIDHFGGYHKFSKTYGKMAEGSLDMVKRGNSELANLNIKLRSLCMIRREKHQVLKQLPDKVRRVVKVEIDNRKEYDLAAWNLQEYLGRLNMDVAKIDKALQAEMLVRFNYLKKLSARGKMAQFVEFVHGIIDQGEKLIVFCWHLETVNEMRRNFPDMLEISGQVSDDKIDENKKLFQGDPKHKLIVITYKRGGTGHTLTAASNVALYEFGWNPKDQDQAEDRAHRIGQKSSVTCHYFVGEDTIDEDIYTLIDEKRQQGSQAIGSTEQIQTTSIQGDLLKNFMKKAQPAELA